MKRLTDKDRQKTLQTELSRVLSILIHEYKAEQVYLYGSLAHGTVTQWSDLDLVVIKGTNKSFCDRVAEILAMLKPRVGMDILVYTPGEWETLCKERLFVRKEIIENGKQLYAA